MKNVHHSESDVLSPSSWNIRRGEKKATTRVQRIWSSHEKGGNKKEWHNSYKASQPIQERKKKRRTCRWWDWQEINSFPFLFSPQELLLSRQGCLYSTIPQSNSSPRPTANFLHISNMRNIWNIASRDLANRLRRYTSNLDSVAEENILPESKKRSIYYFDEKHYHQSTATTWG